MCIALWATQASWTAVAQMVTTMEVVGEQKVRPNDNQPQEGHRVERPGSANDERARGFYMVLLYIQKYV